MALQPVTVVERISQSPVGGIALCCERREVYTSSDERNIKAWNTDDGRLLRSFESAHGGKITCLMWLSQQRLLVSCSLDHSISVWTPKGDQVARARTQCALFCCAYSARHDLILTGGNKKLFVLRLKVARDDSELSIIQTFDEHTDFVSQVVCTPAGRIFSCGYDGFICAYELNIEDKLVLMSVMSGDKDKVLTRAKARCHTGAITSATFNPDPSFQTLITGGFDMAVRIWNHDALTAHAQFLPNHTLNLQATVTGLCYMPATRTVWVTSAGAAAAPMVFDPRTGTDLTDFVPPAAIPRAPPGDRVVRVAADGGGGREAVSVSESRLLYNAYACVSVVVGHTDWVEVLARVADASLDFVSAGADSSVRRWHSPSALYPELYSLKEVLTGHEGTVLAAAVREDGSVLFTGGEDSLIRGFALDDYSPDAAAPSAAALPAAVPAPPSGRLGTGVSGVSGLGSDVSAWAAAAAAQGAGGAGGGVGGGSCRFILEGHLGRVTGLCIVGHYLVSVGWDRSVRIWDSNTGTLWRTIENAHDSAITDVDSCPETDNFATVALDGLGYLWDIETAEMCGVIRGHTSEINKVRWNHVYQGWVTAAEDGSVRMWRKTGQAMLKAEALEALDLDTNRAGVSDPIQMRLDADSISALAVFLDSGHVLVGLSDGCISALDMAREVVLYTYRGHTDMVRSIICFPEKSQVVSAGWDHTIRVWRTEDTENVIVHQATAKALRNKRSHHRSTDPLHRDMSMSERPYAERVPPYEPASLKDYKPKKDKQAEAEPEALPEQTAQQRLERAKEQGHMNQLLKMLESGIDPDGSSAANALNGGGTGAGALGLGMRAGAAAGAGRSGAAATAMGGSFRRSTLSDGRGGGGGRGVGGRSGAVSAPPIPPATGQGAERSKALPAAERSRLLDRAASRAAYR